MAISRIAERGTGESRLVRIGRSGRMPASRSPRMIGSSSGGMCSDMGANLGLGGEVAVR